MPPTCADEVWSHRSAVSGAHARSPPLDRDVIGLQNGARYLYVCPPGGSAAPVWGTDTYTDDSSVCTAAVHKGWLSFTHGGYLTIQIVPGIASYVGSTRNGVTTKSYGR